MPRWRRRRLLSHSLLVDRTPAWPGLGELAARLFLGTLVACSFCGRSSPEAGRIVAGRMGAYICERCIREWSTELRGTTIEEGEAPEASAGGAAGEEPSAN